MASTIADLQAPERRHPHEHRRRSADSSYHALASLLARRACQTPDMAAFIDAATGASTTWLEIANCAQAWRERYPADLKGNRSALLIGIVANSGAEFGREVLSALASGVPAAPLNSALSTAELLWASATLGLTHLAHDGSDPIELRNFRLGRGGLEAYEEARPRPRSNHPSSEAEIEPSALVLRTRGSTGPPKLVPLTATQIQVAARNLADHFDLGPTDRGLIAGPLNSADCLSAIVACLLTGGSLVMNSRHGALTWEQIEESGATWVSVPPEHVEALANSAPGDEDALMERLRFVQVASDALSKTSHAAFWQHTGIPLIESYTLTEAAGLVATSALPMPARRPGSVGLPLGVNLRIVDRFGDPVPPSEVGRIQVKGDTVARYYLTYGRERSMIPAVDSSGWLNTGDLGRLRSDGSLVLVGRETSGEDVAEEEYPTPA